MRHLVDRLTLFPLFGLLVAATSQGAFGYAIDLFQQSIQEPRDAGGEPGGEKDVRALEPGKPHRRELAGGQRHAYRIRLAADQFLKAVIEQDGIDVVAQVSGPDGSQILEFDSESRSQGQEEVSLVAEVSGAFLLIVRPEQNGTSAGSYEIRIEELRVATDTDRALHDARKQFEEALKLRRAGKYDEALPLAERALEIRERLLGTEHHDIADAINGLAGIYDDRGEYVRAEPLYKRALDNFERAQGKDHPDTAEILNNLAELYLSQGKYAEAEPLHKRALDIREKTLGKDHPITAESLHNLAALYNKKGKYADAEPLHKRALDIFEKTPGKDHPITAKSLNNLAKLYQMQGKYGEAEPLFKRAIDIFEKTLSKDHPTTALTLNNLAVLYRLQGKYEEAEPLYKRALDTYEKTLGKDHPDTALSLNNLAKFYQMQGKYGEAEPLFKRAIDIFEKTLGKDHPDTAKSLDNLARLYTTKGDLVQAVMFQSRASTASERDLARNLVIGSEREKLAYLATLSAQTDRTISLHLRYAPDDPAPRNLAATLILQRKARALDATSQNLNALRSRFNTEDQALLDRLIETRSQIAKLVLSGPQKMTIEQHRDRIKTLEDQAEKDEADISRRSNEFRAQFLPVTLEAVRAAIPPDSALIEFASYRPFDPKAAKQDEAYGRPRYVAYVLPRQGEIRWKELGDAKAIDEAVARLRKALRDPRRKDVKNLARAVDQKVFRPLSPLLGNSTRLLISPEGALNLIPFAALVDDRGRYLIERYSISYLSSGRDLLRLQVARKSQSGPLVIADPDFGGRREVEARRLLKQTKAATKKQGGEESPATAFSQFYFPALPYTAEEGEAIRALLPGATLLTKRQASKAFLGQAQSPAILHIATHGFFLEDLELNTTGERSPRKSDDDASRLLKQVEKDGSRIENPLLRAGLALAGANEQREGDNGILTALEMTGLNLWGTKLVTLSACDTGVGEVRNGDGVHGLRRALMLSGAETQVMSLWAVSDRWTRELMVAYYRRLQRGQGRGAALRQAQLEMLKDVKRRHPYYWAGFILSGEWASLEGKREKQ